MEKLTQSQEWRMAGEADGIHEPLKALAVSAAAHDDARQPRALGKRTQWSLLVAWATLTLICISGPTHSLLTHAQASEFGPTTCTAVSRTEIRDAHGALVKSDSHEEQVPCDTSGGKTSLDAPASLGYGLLKVGLFVMDHL
jgi:hypothetical protein